MTVTQQTTPNAKVDSFAALFESADTGTGNTDLGGEGQITTGMTNQWHFYVITNVNGFTNAAFLTFMQTA